MYLLLNYLSWFLNRQLSQYAISTSIPTPCLLQRMICDPTGIAACTIPDSPVLEKVQILFVAEARCILHAVPEPIILATLRIVVALVNHYLRQPLDGAHGQDLDRSEKTPPPIRDEIHVSSHHIVRWQPVPQALWAPDSVGVDLDRPILSLVTPILPDLLPNALEDVDVGREALTCFANPIALIDLAHFTCEDTRTSGLGHLPQLHLV